MGERRRFEGRKPQNRQHPPYDVQQPNHIITFCGPVTPTPRFCPSFVIDVALCCCCAARTAFKGARPVSCRVNTLGDFAGPGRAQNGISASAIGPSRSTISRPTLKVANCRAIRARTTSRHSRSLRVAHSIKIINGCVNQGNIARPI